MYRNRFDQRRIKRKQPIQFTPWVLLVLFLGYSTFQYLDSGQVSWLTDSFRWADNKLSSLYKNVDEQLDQFTEEEIELAGFAGEVTRVVDGDTLDVRDDAGNEYRIRLAGIDAPESDQPYGSASRRNLASLVDGRTVIVQSYKTDDYDRLVGTVWIGGMDICLEQVKAGLAWWYEYHKDEQSRADQIAYANAEREAQGAKRGLWSEGNPINPYDWRQGQR